MKPMIKKNKLVWLISTVIVLLIFWSGVILFQHWGKVKANIQVLPADSTITLDGDEIKSGTVYLSPGIHTFSASRQYFDRVTKQIDTKNINSAPIYLMPIPNSENARGWLSEHPDVQRQREAQGGTESNSTQEKLTKNNSVLDKLPVDTLDYRIDYSVDSNDNISFTITLYAVNKNPQQYTQQLQQFKAEALQFLKSNGVSPSNYSIKYIPSL
jgi:hypothetical protein